VKRIWLACLGLSMLVGCKDPVVGKWEGENAGSCGRDDFEVEDDLTGSGTTNVPNTQGDCLSCDFDLELENDGDGEYSGELEFETCECNGDKKFDVECEIDSDGQGMTCTVDSPCLGEQDFEKDE